MYCASSSYVEKTFNVVIVISISLQFFMQLSLNPIGTSNIILTVVFYFHLLLSMSFIDSIAIPYMAFCKLHGYVRHCIIDLFQILLHPHIVYSYVFSRVHTLKWDYGQLQKNTCTILYHTLHVDLFFSHNFCVMNLKDSRFVGKVFTTII